MMMEEPLREEILLTQQLVRLPRHSEMGPCTATFGTIQGGWTPYIVPDECTASLDLRLVPPVTGEQVIALAEDILL